MARTYCLGLDRAGRRTAPIEGGRNSTRASFASALSLALSLMVFPGMLLGCGTMRPELPDRRTQAEAFDASEADLEAAAETYHAAFLEAGLLLEDEDLTAYLRARMAEVATVAGLDPKAVDVVVVENPFQNASMLANGTAHMHVGLLAQIENEAQLVVVLAHEVSHYLLRHAREAQIQRESARDRANWREFMLGLATAASAGLALVPFEMSGGFAGLNAIVARQVQGYGRDQEREADEVGLSIVSRLGYDTKHASDFFVRLRDEAILDREELNFDGEPGVDDPYPYASHPLLLERIESVERIRAERRMACIDDGVSVDRTCAPIGRDPNGDFEGLAVRAMLRAAQLDRGIGRKRRAVRILDRLVGIDPSHAEGWALLGTMHAAGGSRFADVPRAIEAFERAIELDPSHADVHRELGFLFERAGRREEARAAFGRYLALEPEALDRVLIEKRMEQGD